MPQYKSDKNIGVNREMGFKKVSPEKIKESEQLEKELAKLEQKKQKLKEMVKIPEIAESIKKEMPEIKKMPESQKDEKEKRAILAKIVEEKLKKLYLSSPPKKGNFDIDLGKIKKLPTKEQQIEALVHLAYNKNFLYSISLAQKLNDAFILDTIHDILRDWMYQMIMSKKL